jgi:hypothetical protein
MQTQPQVGTEVTFSFNLPIIIGGARKTGRGVVVGESVVGTDLSALIRVTESADYATGEIIDVRNRNVWAA